MLSWLTAFYSLAVWISQGNGNWYVIWTTVYGVVLTGFCVYTEFATRHAQQKLTQGRNVQPIVDEDDYWIWGQFYYNPHDKKTFINERVGMGMSVNYATPVGKGMAVFVVVVLLAMLPLCGWLIADESAVTELSVSSEAIVAQHRNTVYEISLEDIQDMKLLDELPPATKMWGTGTDNLLKGKFSVEGYGMATLCLNPQETPILMLQAADGIYFLSGSEAEAIYEQLK